MGGSGRQNQPAIPVKAAHIEAMPIEIHQPRAVRAGGRQRQVEQRGVAHPVRPIPGARVTVETYLNNAARQVRDRLFRSENAVKNKFYGKVRKLVRKLNSICRERINRSNKPLRD